MKTKVIPLALCCIAIFLLGITSNVIAQDDPEDLTTGGLVRPAAGTALSTLQFGLQEGSSGQRVIFDHNVSSLLSVNVTFEAWVEITDPTDFQFKSICSRYRGVDEVTPPGTITHTNMYADWNLQVQRGGNLNFFMGGGLRALTDPQVDEEGFNEGTLPYGVLLNAGIRTIPDTWGHVAFSFMTPMGENVPSNISLYFNGVLVDSKRWQRQGQIRQDLSQSHPIELGHYVNPDNQWWPGWMDEVRFWNVFRTQAEIRNDMNRVLTGTEEGLVGYYRFNEPIFGLPNTGKIYPEGLTGTDRENRAGTLGRIPIWANSGVQSLQVGPQTVIAETFNELNLFATDLDQPFLTCNCTRQLVSLPQRGDLYLTNSDDATALTVGSVIPSLVYNTKVYYKTKPGFVIELGEQIPDSFDFRVLVQKTDREFTSEAAVYLLNIVKEDNGGECDPGTGVVDCCGVCGGNNDTCVCLDNGMIRGYSRATIDQIIFLYELELSIAALSELTGVIDSTLENIENSSDCLPLEELEVLATELQTFNYDCLENTCELAESIFDA